MRLVVTVLVAVLVTVYGVAAQGQDEHLSEIFLGRCYEHMTPATSSVNCTTLLSHFTSAFKGKVDASVTASSFSPFFSSITLDVPTSKPLFWSGTMDLSGEVAADGVRYRTLEETALGRVVNGLTFCGSPSSPDGFNHTSCPFGTIANETWYGSQAAFWSTASTRFAQAASGEVRVLLQGFPGRPSYRRLSFFGSVELPHLPTASVTSVSVLLSRSSPDDEPYEKCGTGSLALLEADLKAKGFLASAISCTDDPYIVQAILCEDHPTSSACRFASSVTPSDSCKSEKIGLSVTAVLLALALIAAAVLFFRQKKAGESLPSASYTSVDSEA